jgi:hypothetical protein
VLGKLKKKKLLTRKVMWEGVRKRPHPATAFGGIEAVRAKLAEGTLAKDVSWDDPPEESASSSSSKEPSSSLRWSLARWNPIPQ